MKPIDYIFIDTSVFQSSPFFKKDGCVDRLMNYAEQGYIRIIMPAITEREWQKHYDEHVRVKFEDLDRKAKLIGIEASKEFLEHYADIGKEYDSLMKTAFKTRLEKSKVIRLSFDYPADQLTAIFEKYFTKQKPFGSEGKKSEFPDAFVLASLEKYAKENKVEKIRLFSTDKDMMEFESPFIDQRETTEYLNELITTKIPEKDKQEHIERDIRRLIDYIDHKPATFNKQITEHIESVLSDTTLYLERFNYADVEEAYVDSVNLESSIKDMEIRLVEDEVIRAMYFVEVDAVVTVRVFDEENSIWDSEEKDYATREYATNKVDISSTVSVTVEMDRTELEMGQDSSIKIIEIDCDDLIDAIDEEPTREDRPTIPSYQTLLSEYPLQSTVEAIAKAQAQIQEKLNPIGVAIGSITAMSAALQQMQLPETAKGFQQLSNMYPSMAEAVKAYQKIQNSIPKDLISSINEMAVKGGLGTLGMNKK